MTISPEDLDEVRAHNPDYMNGDTIDQLVARVEELEGVLKTARTQIEADTNVNMVRVAHLDAALFAIDRVLEGTE